ncbi:hypothetical protein GW17_00024754 [Ensete ventricosum]|nr:hypothetical protein GW17_00024754 [Ensete ventricosum]
MVDFVRRLPLSDCISLDIVREKEEEGEDEGEEKGETGDPTSLSLNNPDLSSPSLAGQAVASSWPSPNLRRRGEEGGDVAEATSLATVIAFGSVPSPAMALGCGTTLKIIILGNRGKGASPNSSSSHLDLSYCGQDVIDQLVSSTVSCGH